MSGQMHVLHLLRLIVDPVEKVRVEQLPDKVERVALDVNKREEQLDDVFGRELGELHLQVVLQ